MERRQEKSLLPSVSATVWQIGSLTNIHVRTHMYTLQKYSWRIKCLLVKKKAVRSCFSLSLLTDKKRGIKFECEAPSQMEWKCESEHLCILPRVSLYLFNPPIIDSHHDKALLTRRQKKTISLFCEAGIISKPIYRDKNISIWMSPI